MVFCEGEREPERFREAWERSRTKREGEAMEMVISLGKNWERSKETKPSMQKGEGEMKGLRAQWRLMAWRASLSMRFWMAEGAMRKKRERALPEMELAWREKSAGRLMEALR